MTSTDWCAYAQTGNPRVACSCGRCHMVHEWVEQCVHCGVRRDDELAEVHCRDLRDARRYPDRPVAGACRQHGCQWPEGLGLMIVERDRFRAALEEIRARTKGWGYTSVWRIAVEALEGDRTDD